MPFGSDGVGGRTLRLLLAATTDFLLFLAQVFWLWSFARQFPHPAGPKPHYRGRKKVTGVVSNAVRIEPDGSIRCREENRRSCETRRR